MNRRRFTLAEAEALFGQCVETSVDLNDVPAGTPGQINGWQEQGGVGEYDVIVRFQPTLTTQLVIKWLSKSDFHSSIKEVEGL